MKELLNYVARFLVDSPDEVAVTQVEGERSVILELKVAPDDMGKIIGKHGRIAEALRTIVNAAAKKDGKRISIDIIG